MRELIEKWEKYKLQLQQIKDEIVVMEDADELYQNHLDSQIDLVDSIISDLKKL